MIDDTNMGRFFLAFKMCWRLQTLAWRSWVKIKHAQKKGSVQGGEEKVIQSVVFDSRMRESILCDP